MTTVPQELLDLIFEYVATQLEIRVAQIAKLYTQSNGPPDQKRPRWGASFIIQTDKFHAHQAQVWMDDEANETIAQIIDNYWTEIRRVEDDPNIMPGIAHHLTDREIDEVSLDLDEISDNFTAGFEPVFVIGYINMDLMAVIFGKDGGLEELEDGVEVTFDDKHAFITAFTDEDDGGHISFTVNFYEIEDYEEDNDEEDD